MTTLIIASMTARPTCPSPDNPAGELLLGVGKIDAAAAVRRSLATVRNRSQLSSRRMRLANAATDSRRYAGPSSGWPSRLAIRSRR
jgi:hypothetical protein